MTLLLGLAWAWATAGALAEQSPRVPEATALFEGMATTAAPDEPLRIFSNPAGPAFLEGMRWGVSATVGSGETARRNPAYVHAAGIAQGRDGEGWALWAKSGGRDAEVSLAPGAPASELAAGYTYAVTMSHSTGLGLDVHYRRVRVPLPGERGYPTRDDHYLGVDVGLMSALGDQLVAGLSVRRVLEVWQAGPGGPAESPGGSAGRIVLLTPTFHAGLGYQPNPYLIVEADASDLFNSTGHRAVRGEVRLYPGRPVALRLGVEAASGSGTGWLAGLGVRMPGGNWAISYTYMGGEIYGGIHQLGLMTAAP